MSFEEGIRSTLIYFDLFEHPLREEELFTFLPYRLDLDEFNRELERSEIPSSNGFFYLSPGPDLAALRMRRERKARSMLFAAAIVGRFIRLFPFVRAAFLSGSLSKGVDNGSADIDLFIVSAENRMWVCRSILTFFKKAFLFNSKKFLCPNYFVTDHHMEIPEKNIFTAIELATLRPLYNADFLERLIDSNRWMYEFLPNFTLKKQRSDAGRPFIQKMFEMSMRDGYTSQLDGKLMNYYRGLWKRRYPGLADRDRELRFRSTPYASKVHPNDYQTRVLDAYEERLNQEGLWRLTRLDD